MEADRERPITLITRDFGGNDQWIGGASAIHHHGKLLRAAGITLVINCAESEVEVPLTKNDYKK